MMDTVQKELTEAREVCPTTTRRLLAEGAVLVDVREPDEVAVAGFAECERLLIPMSEIETRWQEIPRDRDVIFACAVGVRSLKATYFLMYQGYDRVANMQYGMKRWAARGFPVTGDIAAAGSEAGGSCCGGSTETTPKSAATSCCGHEAEANAESTACSGRAGNAPSCC